MFVASEYGCEYESDAAVAVYCSNSTLDRRFVCWWAHQNDCGYGLVLRPRLEVTHDSNLGAVESKYS